MSLFFNPLSNRRLRFWRRTAMDFDPNDSEMELEIKTNNASVDPENNRFPIEKANSLENNVYIDAE